MIYEDVENEIVARLQSRLDINKTSIVVLPENDDDFKRPVEKNRITIAYKQSDFPKGNYNVVANSKSSSSGVQVEMIAFEVVIQSRKLRGSDGIYDLIEQCRKSLLGYQPENCGKIYLSQFSYIERVDALWTYSISGGCTTDIVEDNDLPVLVKSSQITVGGATMPSQYVGGTSLKKWAKLNNCSEDGYGLLIAQKDVDKPNAVFSEPIDATQPFEIIVELFGSEVSGGIYVALDEDDLNIPGWNTVTPVTFNGAISLQPDNTIWYTELNQDGAEQGDYSLKVGDKVRIASTGKNGTLQYSYSTDAGDTWNLFKEVSGKIIDVDTLYLKAYFTNNIIYQQIKVTKS